MVPWGLAVSRSRASRPGHGETLSKPRCGGQWALQWPCPQAHPPVSGVGQNLQDHLEVYVQQACTQSITLHSAQKPWRKVWIGLEWLWGYTGGCACL